MTMTTERWEFLKRLQEEVNAKTDVHLSTQILDDVLTAAETLHFVAQKDVQETTGHAE